MRTDTHLGRLSATQGSGLSRLSAGKAVRPDLGWTQKPSVSTSIYSEDRSQAISELLGLKVLIRHIHAAVPRRPNRRASFEPQHKPLRRMDE